jgi:hypothetical protein
MKTKTALGLLAILTLLVGCATASSEKSASPRSRIVGTWRWTRADGRAVTGSLYIRYYADGTCAWWPALEAKFSNHGVTYARYQVNGNVLDTAPDPHSLTFHRYKLLRFNRNTMIVIGEESEYETYERVVPDLEPGR